MADKKEAPYTPGSGDENDYNEKIRQGIFRLFKPTNAAEADTGLIGGSSSDYQKKALEKRRQQKNNGHGE